MTEICYILHLVINNDNFYSLQWDSPTSLCKHKTDRGTCGKRQSQVEEGAHLFCSKPEGPVFKSQCFKFKVSRAAWTKYPTLCSLNNRHLLPHSSEGQRSKTQMWAGRTPSAGGEGESVPLSPWLPEAPPHLCLHVHMLFSLCACVYVQISPFTRTPIIVA